VQEATRLNWPVLLFVTLSPLVAVAGTTWWIISGSFHAQTLVLAVILALATGLATTGGYHRLFSHRSYEAVWPLRLLFLLLGGASVEESAWDWCRDHRRHHRFVDNDGDPYNITKGFWHAHFTWLFSRDMRREEWPRARDLWRDPLVRLQHRFYFLLVAVVAFGLPTALGWMWGDPWGGLLVAGLTRIVVNHHLTFAINSVCHYVGSQPYSEKHTARDNWVTALFTYGEGYHNFHHEFAVDFRNGMRLHQWDPTKWMILIFASLGLAKNLRRVDPELIAEKRIVLQEKRLQRRLQESAAHVASAAEVRLTANRERVRAAYEKVRALRRSPDRAASLRDAQREFEREVAAWEAAVRSLFEPATA
jgi:stearoyl-CoA desaturase (delta-9 desaturase)